MNGFDQALDQVNSRLRLAGLGLQIEQRGQKLTLRGMLPPKPDSQRLSAYQQRLSLGEPANLIGLQQMEVYAKLIAVQTIQNKFDWSHYTDTSTNPSDRSIPTRLLEFEAHFWQVKGATHSQRSTWQNAYWPYLKKLVAIAATKPYLSDIELIYQTILSTAANSRSRQACCTALKFLGEFWQLQIPFDWQKLWGSYGAKHLQARQLPDDQAIAQWYFQIPNPAWRFVYGAIATFGLRNHEAFFCDYSNLGSGKTSVMVQETTKTGSHEVWGFAPEWIETFELKQVLLPAIACDLNHTTLQRVGQSVTIQFKRYGLPFSPYDLRHAWAVRTILYGLPDAIAAQMMGHSLLVHSRTYQRWITHRDQQQTVDTALQKYHQVSHP